LCYCGAKGQNGNIDVSRGQEGFKSSFVEELKFEGNVATRKYAFHSGVDFFFYFDKIYQETSKKFCEAAF